MTRCIEQKGKPRPNGYVRVTRKRQSWYAHRLAWTLANGPIPAGMDVCHKCDNRRCVNVAHLFVGTRTDNMRDARRKGRLSRGALHAAKLPRGEHHWWAKLTWPAVRSIRESSDTAKVAAEKFGVTPDNIRRIRAFNTWKEWLGPYGTRSE